MGRRQSGCAAATGDSWPPFTGGKSSLTVAATNIGDGSEPPNPFDVRLVNIQLHGRLLQCPYPAMEAGRPGSRSRSTDVFRGWSKGGARRAVNADGQAVSPAPAFHCRSPHCPMWPNRRRATPSPTPDQREMPMKQRDPEEHGPAAPGHMTHGPAGRANNPA